MLGITNLVSLCASPLQIWWIGTSHPARQSQKSESTPKRRGSNLLDALLLDEADAASLVLSKANLKVNIAPDLSNIRQKWRIGGTNV